MTEAKPSTYITGIIIFTFIIVGGVSMLAIFNDSDSTIMADEKVTQFNSSFNKMNEVTEQVDTLQEGVEDTEADFGAFGVLNALISKLWQSMRLVFTSFGFMNGVFGGLTTIFGVPPWAITLALALITVMLVFAIISAVFQKNV